MLGGEYIGSACGPDLLYRYKLVLMYYRKVSLVCDCALS